MLRVLWNSRIFILKNASSLTVSIYAIIGFVRTFVSLEGFLPYAMPTECKVLVSVLILIGVWLLCALVVGVFALTKRKRKIMDGQNGKSVYVLYGDLFDKKIVKNSDVRRNICFGVNRCFDTVVDNCLIASASLHGIALNKLYDAKMFTTKSLDTAIQQAISPAAKFEMLGSSDKPKGNLKRYEVGTAVDLPVSDSLHYFMIGLSALNSDLQAQTSRSEYCQTIQKTIEFCDAHAQGQPVLIPIIGGFLSRTGQSEKNLLQYIIKCLELNKNHINQDIYIVVRESAKNTISILDL